MKYYAELRDKIEQYKDSPYHKHLLETAEIYCEKNPVDTLPMPNYDDFSKFFETGSRFEYEHKASPVRKRLSAAVILYLAKKDPKYLNEVSNLIWRICGEITWALTAHLGNVEPKDYRNTIDLVVGVTGAMLCEIDAVLGDDLPERVRALVRSEVETRVFRPFENGRLYWEDAENNWCSVCAGTVGICYMLLAPERLPAQLDRLIACTDRFVASYGEDGCCMEGVGYWFYGFSHYIYFADMLYHFTDKKVDLLHTEKVAKMAQYISHVVLEDNMPVSFSDCNRWHSFSNVGLLSYLYTNYPGFVMPKPAVMDFADEERRLSEQLRLFLWWNPDCMNSVSKETDSFYYFDSAEVFIRKKERYSFAAKAGHNNEPHNHNDIGSFIIADQSGQLLADIGSADYRKETFSPLRYTFFQNGSQGHSVPMVDGKLQLPGREYAGKVLKKEKDEFVLELQGAYEKGTERILRSFKLLDDRVVLTDEFSQADIPVTERLITVVEPEITPEGVRVGNAWIQTGITPTAGSVGLLNRNNNPFTVYYLDFPVSGDRFKAEIILEKRG